MNIDELIASSEASLKDAFRYAEEVAYRNQCKVMDAFCKNKIALRHFVPSTGYGYGDEGRDALNALFADIFGTESALVSPNIVSGTHALTVGLFGVLKAGDTLFFCQRRSVRYAHGSDFRQRQRLACGLRYRI